MNEPSQDHYGIPGAILAAGFIITLLGAGLSFGLYISDATAQAMYLVGGIIVLIGIVAWLILFLRSN